jgi:hypothetical protein
MGSVRRYLVISVSSKTLWEMGALLLVMEKVCCVLGDVSIYSPSHSTMIHQQAEDCFVMSLNREGMADHPPNHSIISRRSHLDQSDVSKLRPDD